MSTPATNIYLCSGVPLNNRYDHTLYFANAAAQLTYFSGKVVRTLNDYSYVRKSWKLKVAATMEAARVWSYLYFQNGTGKRYFYFINQIEYINDNAVELTLEIDVIQTYMFDWTLRPCYVEREHSVNDTWGENTLDEGLDVGELITAKRETIDLSSDLVIMTAASIDINKFYISGGETEDKIFGSYYDGIFCGFQITACPINGDGDSGKLWDDFAIMLNYLGTKGKEDAIFTMWQYPKKLITSNYGTYEWCIAPYVTGTSVVTHTAAARPTSIDGYTPKNKKVLQYPYCFMYVTNNSGGAAVYHYEKFSTSIRTFRVQGNIAPDAVVKLVPVLYKGVDYNYDEALSMGNYPICTWNSDTYKMWLAQNQNQQNLGLAMDGLKIVGGVAAIVGGVGATAGTGGAAGALGVGGISAGVGLISSGASGIASQLAQRADKDIQPPQARGSFSGSHNISRGLQNFDFYHKTIDAYHAEMIDNYFSMYGYATRKVKKPNISSRPSWNYVKTIGSNIGGNICMEDLQIINSIFDKGITFWKNTDVGNYALNNQP